ncbi:YkyA family protein [Neobacillus sp. SM06]|uniref:YkyA family protein n=1 Tax=Neobacillus sp. SM06 TaxID=3422492 RepID=UPI003D279618
MSIPVKIRILFIVSAISLLLSGCFQQQTPSEKMYTVLEKVAVAEKGFEEQQDPLVAAESKEEKLYNQIIKLGMKQYDQIVKLSDEALALTDKRQKLMEKETQSLKESEKQFEKVQELRNELEKSELKQQVNQLYTIMMKRYRAHDVLYKQYQQGISYDRQLYQMLKDKNASLDALEGQINKLNDSYKQIVKANNQFNDLTKQYNEKKLEFYQTAGLKTKQTS